MPKTGATEAVDVIGSREELGVSESLLDIYVDIDNCQANSNRFA
jgi:hypothetical protein